MGSKTILTNATNAPQPAEPITGVNDSKILVFTRTSPFYDKYKTLWDKATAAYNGGRDYLRTTLRKHPSETDEEYAERQESSYNINLIKYSTEKFGDYIFSKAPRRQNADPAYCIDFDRKKKHINTLMREVFDYRTIYSLVWILVDAPQVQTGKVRADIQKKQKLRPYCKALTPLNVPDWDFDDVGELNWAIVEEIVVDKEDATKLPIIKKVRTLYTKKYWQTYTAIIHNGRSKLTTEQTHASIVVSNQVPNKLGRVPLIAYSSTLFSEHFSHPPIDDILTINDAVIAGESELLTNIVKQTYGQLVLPGSMANMINRIKARLAENDPNIDLNSPTVNETITRESNIILSRTKAIVEEGEEKQTARYIQPDGATVDSIITHDDRLISLMMTLYGFLMSTATTQRSSAESKNADNISLAAQLRSIAQNLQELELQIWELFNAYNPGIKVPKITYNSNYDLNELKSVIASIVELANFNCGKMYQRVVKKTALDILDRLSHVSDEDYEAVQDDISKDVKADEPITFAEIPPTQTDASGGRQDSVKAKNDYQKSKTASVSKTEKV